VVKTVAWALLVAAGYYACGRLGLLLALPPGYATAVWPPSGLALAAVLLGGVRMVPGVWLGSFLLNVGTGFSGQSLGLSLGVPFAIALGAAAQATLGAWLINRRGPRPNILAAGSELVLVPMLLLGGPVACLLNASISVGTLYIVGRMPLEAVPFNWWTWWIGDSIGVLLFTPLVLVWAVRPLRTWLRRQIYLTTPLVLLFIAVVVLFVFVRQREQQRIETEFRTVADEIHQRLHVRLSNTLGALSSIEGFYASSQSVEPNEFDSFAQRLIANLEGVTALSWNPVVPAAGRAAFEARVQRAGHPGFRITERDEAGGMRPAPPRGQYVPVEAIVPATGNERALGFNAASEAARVEAMELARDTGRAVASARVRLAQHFEPGLLVMLPVYRQGPGDDTVERRRQGLLGYAVAVFSLEILLDDAVRRAAAEGLALTLADIGVPEPELLFGQPARGGRHDLRHAFAINYAGRSWQLELRLPEQGIVQRQSWGAWFVLAGGLLLTGLLGVLLLMGLGRTAHIEALVTERTEALRRTAAQLARSNRELEQYAYVTSHDLKAPLRTIASFAQLLVQRHGGKLEGEGREFLDFITGGVDRMQELIDDLLQLSRVDARKLEVSPLSMRVAVDRACGALAADLEASHARVTIGELPFVHGDLHMLSQLWQNLIANAVKFQRAGRAPEIRIQAVEGPDDWHFTIRDNGIGIAPAHREQIFGVFRRLHTAEEFAGTGMGLAICKKVVQLHGGEIWVEPAPGEGSTLVFTLPKGGPPAAEAAHAAPNRH
jgi:signal transduction histidine kinase